MKQLKGAGILALAVALGACSKANNGPKPDDNSTCEPGTEDEVASAFPDCEWGVLTPFGTLYGLPTILDEALDAEAEMVFASQRHGLTIRMRCDDFQRLERPHRFRFARPTHERQLHA